MLEISPSTSTIGRMSMSDIQLCEELKKYKNAHRGIVTFKLISQDMGHYPTYLDGLLWRVCKKNHSMNFETREKIRSYLIKKDWLSPAGILKEYGKPEGFREVTKEELPKIIEEKTGLLIDTLSDTEIKQKVRNYIKENCTYADAALEMNGIQRTTLVTMLNGQMKRKLRTSSRQNLLNYLKSKQINSQQMTTKDILSDAVAKSMEQLQTGDYKRMNDKQLKLALKDYHTSHDFTWEELSMRLGLKVGFLRKITNANLMDQPMRNRTRAVIIKFFSGYTIPQAIPVNNEIKEISGIKSALSDKAYIIAGIMNLPNIDEGRKEKLLQTLCFIS